MATQARTMPHRLPARKTSPYDKPAGVAKRFTEAIAVGVVRFRRTSWQGKGNRLCMGTRKGIDRVYLNIMLAVINAIPPTIPTIALP